MDRYETHSEYLLRMHSEEPWYSHRTLGNVFLLPLAVVSLGSFVVQGNVPAFFAALYALHLWGMAYTHEFFAFEHWRLYVRHLTRA